MNDNEKNELIEGCKVKCGGTNGIIKKSLNSFYIFF